MRKGNSGGKRGEKRGEKKTDENENSGHYVIASSRPPERHRQNDDRWNAARSCQNSGFNKTL